jgi:hypothetical protein
LNSALSASNDRNNPLTAYARSKMLGKSLTALDRNRLAITLRFAAACGMSEAYGPIWR